MDRGHDRIPDRDQTFDPTVRRFAVSPLAQSLGAPGATAHRHLHCRLLHRIVSRSLTTFIGTWLGATSFTHVPLIQFCPKCGTNFPTIPACSKPALWLAVQSARR